MILTLRSHAKSMDRRTKTRREWMRVKTSSLGALSQRDRRMPGPESLDSFKASGHVSDSVLSPRKSKIIAIVQLTACPELSARIANGYQANLSLRCTSIHAAQSKGHSAIGKWPVSQPTHGPCGINPHSCSQALRGDTAISYARHYGLSSCLLHSS